MFEYHNTAMPVRDIELCFWNPMIAQTPESDGHRIYIQKEPDSLDRLAAVLERTSPRRMVEIGVYAGGSLVYWAERFPAARLSAFDLLPDMPALTGYLERHGLTDRVRPHLGVSQDDVPALLGAMAADFGGNLLDVVIDDASHLYGPTRTSFEALLPFVRPGGVYVIEDWAWPPMAPLLAELPMLLWSPGVIDRIEIEQMYAVLWRGEAELPTDGSFRPLSGRTPAS